MLHKALIMRNQFLFIFWVLGASTQCFAEDHLKQSGTPHYRTQQNETSPISGDSPKGRYLNGRFQYLDSQQKWREPLTSYRTENSGTFLNAEGETIQYEKGDLLFKVSGKGWFKVGSDIPRLTEEDLSLPNPNEIVLTPLEREIVRLTNQERLRRGLPALRVSPQLQNLSRQKSQNMARLRNLNHGVSPRPPGGENIAYNQATAAAVVRAWMNSDGHRANILNRRYSTIGVGMAENGGPYWTQMFQ